MEFHNIKEILEQYWAGETTIEEEAKLHQYFTSKDVDPELQAYQPLFSFFKQEGSITMDAPIATAPKIRQLNQKRNTFIRIAAAVVLCFGLFFGIWRSNQSISDEEYNEAMAALALVGQQLNKGLSITADNLDQLKTIDDIFQ